MASDWSALVTEVNSSRCWLKLVGASERFHFLSGKVNGAPIQNLYATAAEINLPVLSRHTRSHPTVSERLHRRRHKQTHSIDAWEGNGHREAGRRGGGYVTSLM